MPRRSVDLLLLALLASGAALVCLALAPLWPPSLFAATVPWAWLQSAVLPFARAEGHQAALAWVAWGWAPYAGALRLSPLVEPAVTVGRFLAPLAAAWVAGQYVLVRAAGERWTTALLLSALAAFGAGAGLIAGMPGSDPVAAIVTVALLALVALTEKRPLPTGVVLPAAALGLGAGPAAAVCSLVLAARGSRGRPVLVVTGAVALGWAVACIPLPAAEREALEAAPAVLATRPSAVAALAALTPLTSPALRLVPDLEIPDWFRVTRDSEDRSAWAEATGLVLGLGALGLAAAGLFARGSRPFRVALGLGLAGELAWTAARGFTFPATALRTAPLLLALIGLGLRRLPARVGVSLLATGVAVTGATALGGIAAIRARVASTLPARDQVLLEQARRPADPWPRGQAHTLLAEPGSADSDKSYREPGGSFSPAVGAFGVSLWVVDPAGKAIVTSDSLPLADVSERLEHPHGDSPVIVTDTPYYTARLRSAGTRRLALDVVWAQGLPGDAALVVRSVGPAGGPVRSLSWNGERLLVNGRWRLVCRPLPLRVALGDERRGFSGATAFEWRDDEGWGFARLTVPASQPLALELRDLRTSSFPLRLPPTSPGLHLQVPDARFGDSLLAQRDHLLMGLVGRQTRPGDPTVYLAPWLRDGAYVVVALAYTGELAIARALAEEFAARDAFGGAGPEADSCGLALWALEEVARRTDDRRYDRALWPHVRRKAECIEELLSTGAPVHRAVEGPLLPDVRRDPDATLVADAARDGLIQGRMDSQRPVLYVNAVAYRGLVDAASFAARLGEPELARRWSTRAGALQQAWCRALGSRSGGNVRTMIAGLWPSEVAQACRPLYAATLERHWRATHDETGGLRQPSAWTYFDVAEIHQWLRLGDVERVQAGLDWFFRNQTSPGLFTWWEGGGGAEGWGRWRWLRGWLRPPHITPHYWTAAEMALLQMEMLACDEPQADGTPALLVGAGVPREWLARPLAVGGLLLREGRVDWQWDGRRVAVQLAGRFPDDVRLGPAFPAGTPLAVERRSAPPATLADR